MPDRAFVLVDDEKHVLDTLKQELKRGFGTAYQYETAESVSEAWEVIDDLAEVGVAIVVVVSDWLMPDTKGDEFLLKLARTYPDTLRIMLTGQAPAAAVERVKANKGAHSVIEKPWDIATLRSVIGRGIVG